MSFLSSIWYYTGFLEQRTNRAATVRVDRSVDRRAQLNETGTGPTNRAHAQ